MGAIAGWIAGSRRAPEAEALAPMLEALAHRARRGGHARAGRERAATTAWCSATARTTRAPALSLAFDGSIDNRDELRRRSQLRSYVFENAERRRAGAARLPALGQGRGDAGCAGASRSRCGTRARSGCCSRATASARSRCTSRRRTACCTSPRRSKALRAAPAARGRPRRGARLPGAPLRARPAHPVRRRAQARAGQPRAVAVRQAARDALLEPARRADDPRQARRAGAVEGFLARLNEAVELQADEGCGVLLSGGLDSAVLVALASHRQPQGRHLLARLRRRPRSELPQAAQVAQHFGTEHHELVAAAAGPGRRPAAPGRAARRAARAAFRSRAALRRARSSRSSCRALLTGDGGDEILGGYRRYVAAKFWPDAALRAHRRARAAAGGGLSQGRKRLGKPEAPGGQHRSAAHAARRPVQLAAPTTCSSAASASPRRRRSSCALPFLDHRLAEYVSSLPDEQRVRGLSTKWILRRAAQRAAAGGAAAAAQARLAGAREGLAARRAARVARRPPAGNRMPSRGGITAAKRSTAR